MNPDYSSYNLYNPYESYWIDPFFEFEVDPSLMPDQEDDLLMLNQEDDPFMPEQELEPKIEQPQLDTDNKRKLECEEEVQNKRARIEEAIGPTWQGTSLTLSSLVQDRPFESMHKTILDENHIFQSYGQFGSPVIDEQSLLIKAKMMSKEIASFVDSIFPKVESKYQFIKGGDLLTLLIDKHGFNAMKIHQLWEDACVPEDRRAHDIFRKHLNALEMHDWMHIDKTQSQNRLFYINIYNLVNQIDGFVEKEEQKNKITVTTTTTTTTTTTATATSTTQPSPHQTAEVELLPKNKVEEFGSIESSNNIVITYGDINLSREELLKLLDTAKLTNFIPYLEKCLGKMGSTNTIRGGSLINIWVKTFGSQKISEKQLYAIADVTTGMERGLFKTHLNMLIKHGWIQSEGEETNRKLYLNLYNLVNKIDENPRRNGNHRKLP